MQQQLGEKIQEREKTQTEKGEKTDTKKTANKAGIINNYNINVVEQVMRL